VMQVRAALVWRLFGARKLATAALADGFRQQQPPSLVAAMSGLSCEALRLAALGNRPLDPAALLERIAFVEWPSGATTPRLLRDLLFRCNDLGRRRFLLLVTGRAELPPAPQPANRCRGRGSIVVRYWLDHSHRALPVRSGWELLLPECSEPARLQSMIATAMHRLPEAGWPDLASLRRADQSALEEE